jgi:hypothetical protein
MIKKLYFVQRILLLRIMWLDHIKTMVFVVLKPHDITSFPTKQRVSNGKYICHRITLLDQKK